jgi:hypothetical protein
MQTQKPENPAIALETLRITSHLLSIPCTPTVVENITTLKFSLPSTEPIELQVIKLSETSYNILMVIGMAATPVTKVLGNSQDYDSALSGALFAAISEVIAMAHAKSVSDFCKKGTAEHKVFCQECRNLVAASDYGKNACKVCEL